MQPVHGPEDLAFFASRFLLRWYRGAAHLRRDVERFASTYRIPAAQRHSFRQVVLASLKASSAAGTAEPDRTTTARARRV